MKKNQIIHLHGNILLVVSGIHRKVTRILSSQRDLIRFNIQCNSIVDTAWKWRMWEKDQAPSQYKDHISRYGDFHYKEKMLMRPSYLYNGNSYTENTASLYWGRLRFLTQKRHWTPWHHRRTVGCLFKVSTYLPWVSHICVSELGQHWLREWLVAFSVPSHYLNLYCVIANWPLRNKLKWTFNQNTKLFIHENASENTVCEMTAILSRGKWVNSLWHKDVIGDIDRLR